MTKNQKKLIEKTLAVIGGLAIIVAVGLVLYGFGWTVINDEDMGELFESIFDIDDAGIVFYPAVVVSVLAFWVRAYLKADDTTNDNANSNA